MAERLDFSKGWPFKSAPRGAGRISGRELALRELALARAPLFAGLPKRNMRSVARVTGVSGFDPGTTIVKEGSAGSAFFVILQGTVKVVTGSRTIARLEAGDFFGEISLLDGQPRTASVVAETRTTCLDLAGEDFRSILTAEPAIAVRILRGVAGRLRAAERPPAG